MADHDLKEITREIPFDEIAKAGSWREAVIASYIAGYKAACSDHKETTTMELS